MRADALAFVSFKPNNGGFTASMSVEGLILNQDDAEVVLTKATKAYARSAAIMRSIVEQIQQARTERRLVAARSVWRLGDAIFEMKAELERVSLQVNDLYGHLARDLNVKRKWLEKVIILRRYLPSEILIPESLNWGRCEKGTRRVAEQLRKGVPPV